MGAKPSAQADLLTLKTRPATSSERKRAFTRLQRSLVKQLPDEDLRRVTEAVDLSLQLVSWTLPPEGKTTLSERDLADKVRGLIFGAALGDAAGLATEFLSKAQALEFYGEDADFTPGRDLYPDEHRMMWHPGDWTDDTDQHVLLIQSLLHCGGVADAKDFAVRLHTWRSQGFAELGDESGGGLGQATKAVLNDPTFLENPVAAAAARTANKPTNGAVMRAAAAGIPYFWDEDKVTTTASELCTVTHADPRCAACCAAVCVTISKMLQGCDTDLERSAIEPGLAKAEEVLRKAGIEDTCAEFREHCGSVSLSSLKLDEVGKIGYTFKCVGAGFWALRSETVFKDTLNKIIREAGDADTNGSVAGALLGCRLGYRQLPAEWIKGMPYSSWLEAHVRAVIRVMGLLDEGCAYDVKQ